jgi:[ribosomal protein S5]-alanine N-acetyltransferase
MKATILQTERLMFRPFRLDDLPLIVDLHSDPQVQRYMGGAWSDQEMRDTLDRFVRQQATLGHAKWAAFLRDGTFVGRAGVGSFPPLATGGFGGEMEIGYCFKQVYWGGGFATEAAFAVRDWFFANTPHDRLFGFTEPGNAASQRVLLKIGMTPIGAHDLGFDEPSAVFQMMRP